MGKGDRKTRRGKINSGSYGNKRPHTNKTTVPRKVVSKAPAAAKKPTSRKVSAST